MGELPVEETELTGDPNGKPHREIDENTGQQRAYVVLSQSEREKGFVEPVRTCYVHVGCRPSRPTRKLTTEETKRYEAYKYVAFEEKPDGGGRYWTQERLDSGCNMKTTISAAIAETFARKPDFYGATFCAACRQHFPLDEFVWHGTNQTVGSRQTEIPDV